MNSSKQHDNLIKKYNETSEKLKVYQTNASNLTAASLGSPSKKRARAANELSEKQPHQNAASTAAVSGSVDKLHDSDDNHRATKFQRSHIASGVSGKKAERAGMVHPDRLQQVQGAMAGRISPVARLCNTSVVPTFPRRTSCMLVELALSQQE